MPLRLGKSFDGFVELLVLNLRLLFLEFLDFMLLLQELLLYFRHVLVCFQHLCEEVIGSADGNFCLDQYLHPFHHVLPGCVVESYFSFDVRVDLERLRSFRHLTFLWVGHA